MDTKHISGGWSKWGGPRKQALQPKITGPWCCQSCAKPQHKQSPVYVYEYEPGEHIRVCSSCKNDNCKTFWRRRNQE